MQRSVVRETVDLSEYPALIVITLGLKASSLRSLPMVMSISRGLSAIIKAPPEGLLCHESLKFGWNHFGFRQYWSDVEAMERFTRTLPHSKWWKDFLADPRGCGFWHETYSANGGMEAVYINLPSRVGFAAFAPIRAPVGPFLSSGARLREDAERRLASQIS